MILVGLGLVLPRLSLFKTEPEFVSATQQQDQEKPTIIVDVAGVSYFCIVI